VRYRVDALSGLCAIYFVCYRDVCYRVGALSGIVSIFRVLSGWCAIAPCANGTLPSGCTHWFRCVWGGDVNVGVGVCVWVWVGGWVSVCIYGSVLFSCTAALVQLVRVKESMFVSF